MEYSEGLFGQVGEGAPAAGIHERHSGIQSVQNLEAVINEGLRTALLEETPDQSLASPFVILQAPDRCHISLKL